MDLQFGQNIQMKAFYSPKQVAKAIGSSEASLKRWCDKGLIGTTRTPGGHRRIPVADILAFIRSTGHAVVQPEVLGLPSAVGKGRVVLAQERAQMIEALEVGDDERCRRILFDLYLAGTLITEICDAVVADAFHAIGDHWEHGDVEVYQERRAVETVSRCLHELRGALPGIDADAPLALGGTVERDPYTLPTTMVELVLRERGWNAQSCGAGLPFETLSAALRKERPALCWVSISWLADVEGFLSRYEAFYAEAERLGIPVMVGGRVLTDDIRVRMRYSTFCDRLTHAASFADSLGLTPRKP